MKLTKSHLRKLIKEEMEAMSEQAIFLVVEPSTTYEGEGREVRILGAFMDEASAREALEALGTRSSGEVFPMPVGKLDPTGYHPDYEV
jgi:hypothetical protein